MKTYNTYNQDQEVNAYNNFMMNHDLEQERHRQRRAKKQFDRDNRNKKLSKWN